MVCCQTAGTGDRPKSEGARFRRSVSSLEVPLTWKPVKPELWGGELLILERHV